MTSTLRLVRGPRAALRVHTTLRGDDAVGVTLHGDASAPRAYGPLRALLPHLRARRGDAAVTRALDAHRALLALTLHGLDARLSADERAARDAAGTDPDGLLSHNSFVSAPLFEAWIAALAPLVDDPSLRVVLPDASAHDVDGLAAMVALWTRAAPSRRFELVLGVATDEAPADPLWSADITSARELLDRLCLREDVTVDAAGPAPVDVRDLDAPARAPCDPLDGDREGLCAAAIARTPPDLDAAMDHLRALFRGFGFSAVLRHGLDLLARAPQLDAGRAAALHALVALAAYNRQVRTGDNPGLTAFLAEHFAASLSRETDPARRSHLRYRLCINTGRRAGALEAALVDAAEAVREARDPAVHPARGAFLEAWARNGRAYVLARLGRLDEAREDMRVAWELAQGIPDTSAVPRAEREYSRAVLLDNNAELAMRAGDLDATRAWQSRLAAQEASLSGAVRVAPWRWTSVHHRARDPRGVRDHATEGLRVAAATLDPLLEDTFRMVAGDACYRCGEAREALAHYDAARRIRARADSPEQLRALDVNRALAALRAGDVAALEDAAGEALARCDDGDDGLRAELLAMRGLAAATRGDGARADALFNDAVAKAVATGARDVMLRVARRAGDGCAALGRVTAAVGAYEKALALADVPGDAPPGAVDVASALLSLHALGAAGDEVLVEVTALLARALDDADAWWELPRWAGAAAQADAPLDPDAADTLRRALAARDAAQSPS